MTRPVRLQLSRQRGFNLQATSRAVNGLVAINCARPGKWGNPFKVAPAIADDYVRAPAVTAADAVSLYRDYLDRTIANSISTRDVLQSDIRGFNLACWCRLCARHAATGKPFDEPCPDCAPCHTDVLGARANGFVCEEVDACL